MHITSGLVLAVAGLAAAQSSTSSVAAVTGTTSAATSGSTAMSGCGSQVDVIIQTCLGTENAQLNACAPTDWSCLCTQSTNVLTCYNNCPSDPNAFGSQQQQTSYCNAAKAYGSSSSSSNSTMSATASVSSGLASALASESATLSAATASTTTGSSASATRSSSATGSAASSTGAANALVPAGGVLAAVFSLAALV